MAKTAPSRDAFGLTIDARELPAGCKPPFKGQTVFEAEHRGWRVWVRRVEGDPLPHVMAMGAHPVTGQWQAHAQRIEGASPRVVRAWLDALLEQPAEPEGSR